MHVCMCMYIFLLFGVKEQLVDDDDGIKRYQGTNYYEFVQMSLILHLVPRRWRMVNFNALGSQSFFTKYL